MHAIAFIRDLAVIMLAAGVVTVLFRLLRQPVVLGYIVAGVIILLETLALFGLSSFEVSEHDILRGAALGLF